MYIGVLISDTVLYKGIGDPMSDNVLHRDIQYPNEASKGKIPILHFFLQEKNRNRN